MKEVLKPSLGAYLDWVTASSCFGSPAKMTLLRISPFSVHRPIFRLECYSNNSTHSTNISNRWEIEVRQVKPVKPRVKHAPAIGIMVTVSWIAAASSMKVYEKWLESKCGSSPRAFVRQPTVDSVQIRIWY